MRIEEIVPVIIVSLFSCAVSQADEWTDAEKAIRHLKPDEFVEAPEEFRAELKSKKCLIPQPHDLRSDMRANVISGEFSKKGQKDWAALCSRDGKSSIIIYWGGASSCPNPIAEKKNKTYLQGTGSGIGFSRQLKSDRVVKPVAPLEGESVKIPKITHHGIQDIFVNKAADTYYCHNGKWLDVITGD